MDSSNIAQDKKVPNIHVPQNDKVLAYLKEMHPFHEIIVPFSADKVSKDITPSDFIGRFSLMSTLPPNSKYVVYGSEALVHPTTGILFGFITGTSAIYRLPDHLIKEIEQGNIMNFRVMKTMGGNGMDDLESNWVSSPSITEQLVHKCFEHWGDVSTDQEVVHLDMDMDLTTPRTREFESRERSSRWLSLGAILFICALGVLLLYAANYVMTLF